MGTFEVNDEHSTDLSRLQEMHEVVDRLRQLYAAAYDADQAGEVSLALPASEPAPASDLKRQSTPGR
ncbi:MAG: hypothetical protein ACRDYV_14790 [Acidimicrobiia bacterium]